MLRTLTYILLLFLFWAMFARWYYVHFITHNACDQLENSQELTSQLGKPVICAFYI